MVDDFVYCQHLIVSQCVGVVKSPYVPFGMKRIGEGEGRYET